MGNEVLRQMRGAVAIGLSPVRDVGRYKPYAIQRKGGGSPGENLYPNTVRSKFPNKNIRPVNLWLDGTYINSFTFRRLKNAIEIGLFEPPELIRKMFETHNDGALEPDVPQRKVLPNEGEGFIITIQRSILDIFSEAIRFKTRR